jgi:hypothetical protein
MPDPDSETFPPPSPDEEGASVLEQQRLDALAAGILGSPVAPAPPAGSPGSPEVIARQRAWLNSLTEEERQRFLDRLSREDNAPDAVPGQFIDWEALSARPLPEAKPDGTPSTAPLWPIEGSVVSLNGGGPLCTVARVWRAGKARMLEVYWFHEGQLHEARLPVEAVHVIPMDNVQRVIGTRDGQPGPGDMADAIEANTKAISALIDTYASMIEPLGAIDTKTAQRWSEPGHPED